MQILINDIMQYSTDAPPELISPALSDICTTISPFNVTFLSAQTINCVGIGYTDATTITISNGVDSEIINISSAAPYHNGLYLFNTNLTTSGGLTFTITHNGTYIGRLALGTYRTLNTSVTKETGFYTTNENRITASGQIISGAGGYYGRRFEGDVRYKIDSAIYNDFETAFQTQIMKGFPYFLYLNDELHKLPVNMKYMYMRTDKPLSLLQSSTYKFLYSYKFSFYESF